MKKYSGYEIINIRPQTMVEMAKYKFVGSEWMVCIDGPSKTAWEVNRKTGKRRPYDYAKAMRELFS